MERHNTRQAKEENEYKDLKKMLSDLGYYEDGMELQEMRQVMDAIRQSEDNSMEDDLERALRESELDFMHVQEGMANSTMITASTSAAAGAAAAFSASQHSYMYNVTHSTQPGSPDLPAEHLTVFADVHHPLDWSPPHSPHSPAPSHVRSHEKMTFLVSSKIEMHHIDAALQLHQHNDSGLSSGHNCSTSSSINSILSLPTYTPSLSEHSELSELSQSDENIGFVNKDLSWNDYCVQASSSSVAISSDENTPSLNPLSV